MTNRTLPLTERDHQLVSDAVAAAEAHSSGEIVTIVTDSSDDYGDVRLAWSAVASFMALGAIAMFPAFWTARFGAVLGRWNHEWDAPTAFALAALVATLKFAAVWLIQSWRPLRLWLVPSPVKTRRVHEQAIAAFRIGAERRTHGRTGILIYLSLAERRAEIVADAAINALVDESVWGEAMLAMLAHLRGGKIADAMVAAIEQVGTVLARHLPHDGPDTNELPDRLIEI